MNHTYPARIARHSNFGLPARPAPEIPAPALPAYARDLLLGALEYADESVFITDRGGNILYVNRAFEEETGYGRTEVIGDDAPVPGSDNLPSTFYDEMFRVLTNGEPFPLEFGSHPKQDGLSGSRTITPVLGDSGDVDYYVGTNILGSEGQESSGLETGFLRARKARPNRANRVNANLLSTISHELRTPLAAIISYTTAILEYGEDLGAAKVTEYLHHVEARSKQLERLICDLLTMSLLESDNLPLEFETVDLYEVIEETIEDCRFRDHVAFRLLMPEQPIRVTIDVVRIREVLQNLIENVEKYAGVTGTADVSIRLVSRGMAEATIRDHGAGVSKDDLEAIFRRFYRAKTSAHTAGSGLGLAICRSIVNAHGGKMAAYLPAGGGLAISFTVPRAQANPA